MGKLHRRIFGISIDETRYDRRGFRGTDPDMRRRLESIGATFVAGYHAALEFGPGGDLETQLGQIDDERRGFAYEGAAMGLALLDALTPWPRGRWQAFLAGPGSRHAYMLHVGAGWALARLGRSFERSARRMDPLLRWLVLDGWGFHDGYFKLARAIERQAVPRRIAPGYPRRAYDQGLGRALWFVESGEVARIATTIGQFDAARRTDLWSGVGLAAAYAGGRDADELDRLREVAGPHHPALAQGAAFAAQARRRAGNDAPHTELACRVLCGASAAEAAAATDECCADLPSDGAVPAYEVWRARLRQRFASQAVTS